MTIKERVGLWVTAISGFVMSFFETFGFVFGA